MSRTVCIIGTRGYPSYYGGFETLIRNLAPYLIEHGWDVVVYGRTNGVDADRVGVDHRVRSVITPGLDTKSLSTLSYGLTSSVHAARSKPDVALVMNVANGFFLPMLKARGIPTLVNVDGLEWERDKWGPAAKAVFRAGARTTAKYATDLIYDSRELGRRWHDSTGREGIFIPYGGVLREPGNTIDGLTPRRYALMVARFVPENSIAEFLDAAKILSRKWDVVIVGSAGYGGDVEQQVLDLTEECPAVRWYGHIHNDDMLFSLWENAGAYFHGHSVGGTNPALVQAMACGAPTVARDTRYNREVLGDSAVFVEPHPEDIAIAMDELLSSASQQNLLSKGVSERARDLYTWQRVCADYEAALAHHLTGR